MTTSPTNYTDNIYTADGTLAGNRNVAFNNNNLAFDTDKLFVNGASGNVGIGTASPDVKFRVDFALGEPLLKIGEGAGRRVILGDITAGSWGTKLTVDGEAGYSYFEDGNVGIGDTTPDALLDVAGSFRLDGTFGDKDGDVGTAGQILSSTVTGTDWIDSNSLTLGSIDNHSDVDTTTTAPVANQVLS